ncbi:MAG: CHAT domain-containing protein, partial [Acidobacteria bacterium]|nr:CHAT domain-containing protein [Acidobacteriota bacterium]
IYLGYFALAAQQQDVSKAFEVLERVRGRTAADILRSRPPTREGQPQTPSPIETHISRLQVQLMRAKSPKERKELLDALFEAEQRLAPVVNARENWQRGFLGKPVGLKELQSNLRPDEALLEYVLTESAAFCLALTREEAKLITLPMSGKSIEAFVEAYLNEIKSKRLGQEAARNLYSALLGPLPEDLRKFRLLVVPDGKLHLLPFDSLTGPDRQYLVYSHLVTYAPSATVLYLLRTSGSATQASLPFLGVGDVAYDEEQTLLTQNQGNPLVRSSRGLYDLTGTQFPRLPATRQEVVSSGAMFGEDSAVLLGSEATEAAFKSQPLEKFRILHLAVHGVSSSEFPQRAALVLGTDTQANEDGLLQAREISALSLNADLVILSACDTGAGRLQGAEGIANLVRSFLFAGARSVLASLWSADDIATAALVKQFYAHLGEEHDKASALRQAKIDLFKKYGDQALPYYWAGFTLQGEGASTVPVSQ